VDKGSESIPADHTSSKEERCSLVSTGKQDVNLPTAVVVNGLIPSAATYYQYHTAVEYVYLQYELLSLV
jgi:hypothetical protein